MVIVQTTVHTKDASRGGLRAIFSHLVDDGMVLGPFVEHRPTGEDVAAFAAAHAVRLASSLSESETQANLESFENGRAMKFNWSTAAIFRQRIRNEFRDATGLRLCNLARRLRAFGLTDAQLKNLFGLNDSQLATFKTRLQELENKYTGIVNEVGQ